MLRERQRRGLDDVSIRHASGLGPDEKRPLSNISVRVALMAISWSAQLLFKKLGRCGYGWSCHCQLQWGN